MGTFDPAAVPGWPQGAKEESAVIGVDEASGEDNSAVVVYTDRESLPQQVRRAAGILNDWARDSRLGNMDLQFNVRDGELDEVIMIDLDALDLELEEEEEGSSEESSEESGA